MTCARRPHLHDLSRLGHSHATLQGAGESTAGWRSCDCLRLPCAACCHRLSKHCPSLHRCLHGLGMGRIVQIAYLLIRLQGAIIFKRKPGVHFSQIQRRAQVAGWMCRARRRCSGGYKTIASSPCAETAETAVSRHMEDGRCLDSRCC